MAFVIGGQAFEIQSRSLRTGARNLQINGLISWVIKFAHFQLQGIESFRVPVTVHEWFLTIVWNSARVYVHQGLYEVLQCYLTHV